MTLQARYYLSPSLSLSSAQPFTSMFASFHSEIQYGNENEIRAFEYEGWQNRITPQIAAATLAISQQYPWLSPGVATGAAFAGIPLDDPSLKWLASREAETQDRGGLGSIVGNIIGAPFTLLKGTTRLVLTGFDGIWEEGLARPLRTSVGIYQGIDDPYAVAGASIATRAVGGLFGGEAAEGVGERAEAFLRNVTPLPSKPGEGVNLGGGYLPSSNVATVESPEVQALTELYRQRGIPDGRAELQAISSVQQSFGAPISDIAREQANMGIQIQSGGGGGRVSVNPGNLLGVGFGMDTDTMAFNIVSGLTNFAAQIFLDPTNIGLMGLSRARLASRVLTKGQRSSRVFGQNVDKFRGSGFYKNKLTPRLAQMDSMTDIRNALGVKSGANIKETTSIRALILALKKAKSAGAVDEILTPHLGVTIRKTPKPENLATLAGFEGRTLGQTIGGSESIYKMLGASPEEAAKLAIAGDTFGLKVGLKHRSEGTWAGRLFQETSERTLDTSNMDEAFFTFGKFLDNAGFKPDEADKLLEDFARLADDDHTGAFQTLKRAMQKFNKRIVDEDVAKGADPKTAQAWADSFTKMFESEEAWRKYWISQSDNPAWFPGAKARVVANGEIHQIEAKPTVHMISELVSRQIPLPDPREMRRLMSELSRFPIAKLTATRRFQTGTNKATFEANVMTNISDFYMQKIWKPMVLLRFAWPVRVIGEEQLRAAAAGRFSLFRHPFTWLSFATGKKGNRILTQELPSPREVNKALSAARKEGVMNVPDSLGDFYNAMAASHGGWLTTKGNMMTVAGYRTVNIDDADFIDAWIWNLAKIAQNDTIVRRIDEDGIDAAAEWLFSGTGQHLLKKMKDSQEMGSLNSYEGVHQYLQSLEARMHIVGGGDGYIWWDSAAAKWRDHYDQFVPDELAPPPPKGFDPGQEPLPGMAGGPRPKEPTPTPGAGQPPYRPPAYGEQGAFDTSFQSRIQAERTDDYRSADRWMHGDPPAHAPEGLRTVAMDAYEFGSSPSLSVYGDSLPLDRTWGDYDGLSDDELISRMITALGEYHGQGDYDNLGYVGETADILMQSLMHRYPDEELSGVLRKFFTVGGEGDPSKFTHADDMHQVIRQYERSIQNRVNFENLERAAGTPETGTVLGPLRDVYNPAPSTGSSGVTDFDANFTFITMLYDELAHLPHANATHEDIIKVVESVIEDFKGMPGTGDEIGFRLEGFKNTLRQGDAADNAPIKDLSDDDFAPLDELVGKRGAAYREADLQGQPRVGSPEGVESTTPELRRAWAVNREHHGYQTSNVGIDGGGLDGARTSVLNADGQIPTIELSRILQRGQWDRAVPRTDKIPGRPSLPQPRERNLDQAIKDGIQAMRDESDIIEDIIAASGYKITMDDAARQLLTPDELTKFEAGITDSLTNGLDWSGVQGASIADRATGGLIRKRAIVDLNRSLQSAFPNRWEYDEALGLVYPHGRKGKIVDGDPNARDNVDLWEIGQADDVRKTLRTNVNRQRMEHVAELRSQTRELTDIMQPEWARQAPGGSLHGARSARSIVSDILQYGQTWKAAENMPKDGLVLWSDEMGELVKALAVKRNEAIGAGKVQKFDDDVRDAIFAIAQELRASPSRIYDEFDEAITAGQRLSGVNLDIGTAGFNTPMGAIVTPNTITKEMTQRVYANPDIDPVARAAAWDELDPDAPVLVYAFATDEQATKMLAGGPIESTLVSVSPEIARYYSAPLVPSGMGLPALGHGRFGEEPLIGILEGGYGASSTNLVGPGLYTTSHGAILGGYAGHGAATSSITQIKWRGEKPPKILNLGEKADDHPELMRHIEDRFEVLKGVDDDTALEALRAKNPELSDAGIAQLQHDLGIPGTGSGKPYLDNISAFDLGDELLQRQGETLYAYINRLKSYGDDVAEEINEAIFDYGFHAISHQGGIGGGSQHQVFVWLWGSMRKGLLEGEAVDSVGAIARAGAKGDDAKLIAMRVRKQDVKPSWKAAEAQTDGELITGFGYGGRVESVRPEQMRLVSHKELELTQADPEVVATARLQDPGNVGVGKPSAARFGEQDSRTLDRWQNTVDERIRKAADAAHAKGVRVQVYTDDNSVDGFINLHAIGRGDRSLHVRIGPDGTATIVNAKGVDTDVGVAVLLGRLLPVENHNAWWRSNYDTTTSSISSLKSIRALPEGESEAILAALDDIPSPAYGLQGATDDAAYLTPEPKAGPPHDPTQDPNFRPERDPVPRIFQTQGEADPQLKELIARRKYAGAKEGDEPIRLPKEHESEVDERLLAHLNGLKGSGRSPDKMPYRDLEMKGDRAGMLDKALNTVFYHLMSKPTNYLSRSPVWKQAFIQRVLELRSFSTVKVQKQIDEILYKSVDNGGMGLSRRNARQILGQKPMEVGDHGGTITSMRSVEDLAKSFALEETKALLYDATKRHNISDITRNIFPFAEAWAEVIGVWSRIAFEHPEVLRRAQQGLEGARDSGFFHTNDQGDEVFVYPGLDLIGNWMLGSGQDGAGVEFSGRTAGLNIALGGYLPGFGPTVQLPVSMAADHMPVGWDWVKDLVLPFGANDIEFKPGDLLNIALPAWYKRGLTAIGVGGREYQQQYFNSVIDVFKLKTIEDPRLLNDPVLANQALEDSFGDAKAIGLMRAFAQFFLPTGPQITYLAGDTEGKNWTFQALSSEYYTILARNDHDQQIATKEFIGRFGLDPFSFTTAKSVRTIKMPTTKSGDVWFRNNQDLFDNGQYPTTAAYSLPDLPWDEFDYDAYHRQLELDARQGVSPEVWLMRRNQLLGGIQYENAREIVGERTDSAARAWLRQIRVNLMLEHPGFGLNDLPGLPGRATLDQKMMELQTWASEPRLAQSGAGKGLAVYLELREQAQVRAMEQGYSPSGFQTADQMEYIRTWLRESAAKLMAQYPDFAALWFDVFAAELEEAQAPTEPLELSGLAFKESA